MVLEMTDHSGEIVLSIPSVDRYVYLVDLVISYVSKEMQFDEETTEQVNLAVVEAGTNAIGFDPENVGDPLSPDNFMKPSGRGIFLMRAFMDEVEYKMDEGSGTEVRLVKYKH